MKLAKKIDIPAALRVCKALAGEFAALSFVLIFSASTVLVLIIRIFQFIITVCTAYYLEKIINDKHP